MCGLCLQMCYFPYSYFWGLWNDGLNFSFSCLYQVPSRVDCSQYIFEFSIVIFKIHLNSVGIQLIVYLPNYQTGYLRLHIFRHFVISTPFTFVIIIYLLYRHNKMTYEFLWALPIFIKFTGYNKEIPYNYKLILKARCLY